MRKTLTVLIALAALTACGGEEAEESGTEVTTSASASSSSAERTTSKVPTSTPARPPAPTSASTPAPTETPEQQFLTAMRASGIVPQLGNEADPINLATSICVAFGSGESFLEVSNTLAGGSLSLGQIVDLIQASTEYYCPRFFVPEP